MLRAAGRSCQCAPQDAASKAKAGSKGSNEQVKLYVMQDENGRVVMLYIGDRQFRRRLEKFRLSYPEIQKRAPESNVFDLRIEGNILSVPQDGGKAERIVSPEVPSGA